MYQKHFIKGSDVRSFKHEDVVAPAWGLVAQGVDFVDELRKQLWNEIEAALGAGDHVERHRTPRGAQICCQKARCGKTVFFAALDSWCRPGISLKSGAHAKPGLPEGPSSRHMLS